MKVLHIGKYYPPYRGGMETHLQTLCGELRKDIDVRVLVANDGRDSLESCYDGVPVSRAGTMLRISSAPFCPSMAARIRREQADIVHIHLPNPTAILAWLASHHPGRLVLTWHSDVIRQKLSDGMFRPILNMALRRCSAIISTSPNYIVSSPVLQRSAHLCRVIPFGISVRAVDQSDEKAIAEIRRRYGPRIVLSVGRLVYYKGFEYLIRAMSSADARLVIIGSGPLREKLQVLISSLGLHNRVSLLGGVADVRPWLQAADVFVLPSIARSEAFGIVQLEAMACRKPVINTEIPSGVPFVSLNGVTGITVRPRSSGELAAAIRLLVDNPELRRKYGSAGRARVEREFSLETMARGTLDLYADVLAMKHPVQV